MKNSKAVPLSEVKATWPQWEKRDNQQVRVQFRNFDKPGKAHTFHWKPPYPGASIEKLTLKDGERYTISVGWANYINTNCMKTEFQDAPELIGGERGIKPMLPADGAEGEVSAPKVARKFPRFGVFALDYCEDLVDNAPGLWERETDIQLVSQMPTSM